MKNFEGKSFEKREAFMVYYFLFQTTSKCYGICFQRSLTDDIAFVSRNNIITSSGVHKSFSLNEFREDTNLGCLPHGVSSRRLIFFSQH